MPSQLQSQSKLVDSIDTDIKSSQRRQLEEIYEVLRSSDLIVDNRKVNFQELLQE